MDQAEKRKQSFLLRLPATLREEATDSAHKEGISLNHLISLAVAEKISRMERESHPEPARKQPLLPWHHHGHLSS